MSLPSDESITRILDDLSSDDVTRVEAALYLCRRHAPEIRKAVPILVGLLRDAATRELRFAAGWTLGKYTIEDCTKTLLEALPADKRSEIVTRCRHIAECETRDALLNAAMGPTDPLTWRAGRFAIELMASSIDPADGPLEFIDYVLAEH